MNCLFKACRITIIVVEVLVNFRPNGKLDLEQEFWSFFRARVA